MIVYACKYTGQPWIEEAVASARSWMPEEPVLVVDSDSADISYFQKVESLGATVADAHNLHYETGAWWYAYDHSDSTYFFFLHDSTLLRQSLATFKALPVTVFGTLENWTGADNHRGSIASIAVSMSYTVTDPFWGVMGSMFGCQREVLDRLAPHRYLPTDKYEAECMERVWGMALMNVGVDVKACAWGPGERLATAESPFYKFLSRRT